PPANAGARSFNWKVDTRVDAAGHRVVMPARSTPDDPTLGGTTGGGATLTVYDSNGSGEKIVVTLPASGWTASDTASRPHPYRFRSTDSNGPVSRITVKKDQVKIRGGKSNWGYTLDEAHQGRIAVRLRLGTGMTWCADAPAKSPASSYDKVDKFVAQPRTAAP